MGQEGLLNTLRHKNGLLEALLGSLKLEEKALLRAFLVVTHLAKTDKIEI